MMWNEDSRIDLRFFFPKTCLFGVDFLLGRVCKLQPAGILYGKTPTPGLGGWTPDLLAHGCRSG